jgi:hypothetical protein
MRMGRSATSVPITACTGEGSRPSLRLHARRHDPGSDDDARGVAAIERLKVRPTNSTTPNRIDATPVRAMIALETPRHRR